MNIVSGRINDPQAILIRGVEEISGPGKVGKVFEINKNLNDLNIINNNFIWLEDDGFLSNNINYLPRVGIDYANEKDINRLARLKLIEFPK